MPGESDRKQDHIRVVREENVESGGTGFSDVFLEHEALPEINKKDIDTSVELLNHRLNAPIFIESMTGGHPETKKINQSLAYAAQKTGVAMGVGSQRAGLEDESVDSYTIVREVAPDAFIYGNIGVSQLSEYGVEGVERAVEMIDADAMSVHLNFLQEAVQPEGDINAEGCLENIKTLSRELSVPLIVKETGNGISRSTAKKLADSEVDLLDVAGKGGTTWSGVEAKRAREKGEKTKENLGKLYSEWGIPTVVSIVETCFEHPKIVASGGIRSGLDIAKSISLGADFAGLAKPMLSPAVQGKNETRNTIEQIVEELRTAMFITGSKDVEELSKVEAVVTGKTLDYLTQLQQSK